MSQTTLTEVLDAMIARLKAAFPNVYVGVFSPQDDFAHRAPALLVELQSFPLGKDPGDFRYPANCHFLMHCVMPKDKSLPEL